VVLSEELCILSSCFLSPMSKNSVLDELRVRRLLLSLLLSAFIKRTFADATNALKIEIGSHPGRDLLKCILRVVDA